MALPATHIQFALDHKEQMDVQNLSAYLSGTIYPDSRYITKVPREMTHNDSLIDPAFYMQSDFKKGWALHFLCDRVQHDAFYKRFPQEFIHLPIEVGSEEWIAKTALKVLQDLAIVATSECLEYLSCLSVIEQPNNELKTSLERFNEMIISLYSHPTMTVDSYTSFFKDMGASVELTARVRNKMVELSERIEDPSLMLDMYKDMNESVQKILIANKDKSNGTRG